MKKLRKDGFERLIKLMTKLRSEDGCPWDRAQTHKSLLPYLIEEAYEVWDTIDLKDDAKLKEELGDLLLQIIFHAQIAKERKKFDINEVVDSLIQKLKERHPHVFRQRGKITPEEVLKNWEHIKLAKTKDRKKSVIGGLPNHLPALLKAYRLQEKTARFNFDWENKDDILLKIQEEFREFKKAYRKKDKDKIEEELGDIFFSWVNLSRHLKINPELSLRKTIDKFIRRFNYIETQLAKKKKPLSKTSLSELDRLWNQAKQKGI